MNNNNILEARTPTLNLIKMSNTISDIIYLENEEYLNQDDLDEKMLESMRKDAESTKQSLKLLYDQSSAKNQGKWDSFSEYLEELLQNIKYELKNRRKN